MSKGSSDFNSVNGNAGMQPHDVKEIVAEVLAEQKRLHNSEADEVVLKTIATDIIRH